MLRIALVLTMAFTTGACTTVRIEAASKDDVEVKTCFGIVSVELKPGARGVVVESKSFGAIYALEGFTLGYHDASYAALAPDDCRVVLWIRTDEQLKELDRLLRERTDICAMPGLNSTGRKK